MTNSITLSLPHAMIQGINAACIKQGYTTQELIRIAISKMLFDEFKSAPETNTIIAEENNIQSQNNIDSSDCEIPLDKIISVRYTLDDGKIIHIMRGKKSK
ncbi:MAG: hypothetical protein KGI28_07895 [Thaumarchaeota archaeon]|nr:hypothetical protein [Nitrososphaerota archaeon]